MLETVVQVVTGLAAVGALIISLRNRQDLTHHQSAMRAYESEQARLWERTVEIEQARDDRVEVEQRRARLSASYSRPHLRVSNSGGARARDVEVFVDGQEWSESGITLGEGPTEIDVGAYWLGKILPSAIVADPKRIELRYRDAVGEHEWGSDVSG